MILSIPDRKYFSCCNPLDLICPACLAVDDGRVYVPIINPLKVRVTVAIRRNTNHVDPHVVDLLRPHVN